MVLFVLLVLSGLPRPAEPAPEPEPRLREAITRAVSARNGFPPSQLEVKIHTTRLPDAAKSADQIIAEVPDFDDAIGPVTLRARFLRDGVQLASVPIPARVSVFADALITMRRVQRHDVIRPGDLRRERVEITNLVKWVVIDSAVAIGSRAKRTITPGTIVDKRWLEEVPLVMRGDRVTMATRHNGVSVSAVGVAMEDGYRNQEIRVKAGRSNRLLKAVVLDAGTVAPVH